MDNSMRDLAKLAINILANVAAIGYGIAMFESRPWCLVMASVAAIVAASLTLEVNKNAV